MSVRTHTCIQHIHIKIQTNRQAPSYVMLGLRAVKPISQSTNSVYLTGEEVADPKLVRNYHEIRHVTQTCAKMLGCFFKHRRQVPSEFLSFFILQ
jgi:hypothetical protein